MSKRSQVRDAPVHRRNPICNGHSLRMRRPTRKATSLGTSTSLWEQTLPHANGRHTPASDCNRSCQTSGSSKLSSVIPPPLVQMAKATGVVRNLTPRRNGRPKGGRRAMGGQRLRERPRRMELAPQVKKHLLREVEEARGEVVDVAEEASGHRRSVDGHCRTARTRSLLLKVNRHLQTYQLRVEKSWVSVLALSHARCVSHHQMRWEGRNRRTRTSYSAHLFDITYTFESVLL